jgi:hypothetical protein
VDEHMDEKMDSPVGRRSNNEVTCNDAWKVKFFIAFLWEGGFFWDEMLDEYLGTKMMNPVTNYIYGRMENKLMYYSCGIFWWMNTWMKTWTAPHAWNGQLLARTVTVVLYWWSQNGQSRSVPLITDQNGKRALGDPHYLF